jgi:hypothetical protein
LGLATASSFRRRTLRSKSVSVFLSSGDRTRLRPTCTNESFTICRRWRRQTSPCIEWGTATDSKRIYVAISNSFHVPTKLINRFATKGSVIGGPSIVNGILN